MAIAFVTSVKRTGNVTTAIVDRTSTTNGNVAVCAIVMAAGNIVTPGAGWTLIHDIVFGVDEHLYVYRRVTSSSDPVTWSFTTDNGANTRVCSMNFEFSGVDTTTPVDVASEQANASSTSVTAPGVDPNYIEDMLVFFGGASNIATWTPPTSPAAFTEPTNGDQPAATAVTLGGSYLLRSTGAATGDVVATLSSAAANAGILVALKDASATPDGGGPVDKSGTDTITVSVTDSGAVAAASVGTDTITVAVTDTGSVATVQSKAGTDTVAVSTSESATIAAALAGTDFARVTFSPLVVQSPFYGVEVEGMRVGYPFGGQDRSRPSETTVAVGGPVAKSGNDSITISATDTGTVAAANASTDTVTLSLTDTGAVAAQITGTDTITVSTSESGSKSVVAQKSGTDTITVSASESGSKVAISNKAGTDAITVSTSESATLAAGIAGSDTATMSMAEAGPVAAQLAGADMASVSLSDTSVLAAAIVAGETVTMSLVDGGTVLFALGTNDTITVSTSESGSVTDGAMIVPRISATVRNARPLSGTVRNARELVGIVEE